MNDLELPGGTTSPPATVGETAASAVAAREEALVKSRFIVALKRPRNWDQVRQDILKECRRPGFAQDKSVLYRKPIGQGVEGLGIRFVEAALRHVTNVHVSSTLVYEDEAKEIHRVSVTDLESNTGYDLEVKVPKTVERSKPLDDGSYISVRKNSRGANVYTIPATEDDMLNQRLARISKAIRTNGLRLLPGDIADEAEAVIRKIRLDAAAQDPDAERKKIADAFASINVRASDLAAYLGHDLGTCSPAELVELRGLYGAIRDGESSWAAVMEAKFGETDTSPPPAAERPHPRRKAETGPPENGTDEPPHETTTAKAETKDAVRETPSASIVELEGGSTIVRLGPAEAKPNFKLLAEIYKAEPLFDAKLGERGAAKRLLREDYHADAESSLSAEAAEAFLTQMHGFIGGRP